MQALVALVFVITVSTVVSDIPPPPNVGGVSEVIKAPFAKNDEAVQVIASLAPKIRQAAANLLQNLPELQDGIKDAPVTLLQYRTQVVAGTLYLTQVKVAKNLYALRIVSPIKAPLQILSIEGPFVDPNAYSLHKE